jgi:hypothetical protein
MKKQSLLLGLLFAAFSLMAQVPNYVPANGLVGWWPFNGNANDESGNGNNGSVNGATLTTDRFGNTNKAYSFDGIDDGIITPDSGFPYGSSDRSINLWVNDESVGTYCSIMVRYGLHAPSQGCWILHNNNCNPTQTFGNLRADFYNSGVWSGNNSMSNSNWNMISVSMQNGNCMIYLNGMLIAQGNVIANTTPANNSFYIGGDLVSIPNYFFNGKLDDIGIWNRALTQQEITTLYNAVNCPTLNVTITPVGSTTFCAGNSVTLTAGGGNTYSWSNGSSNQSITISNGATYTVTVTDANNCTATASQVVTVNSLPGNGVNVSGNTTFCSGGSVTLTAQGTGTYLWSNSATNKSITVNQGGSYTVTVTSANNCTASSAPVNVTVNQTPTAGISAGGLTAFCQGGSVVLTASGGGSYNWNTGSSSQSITVTNGATYTVTVSNGNCTASATQNVTVYPTPSVSINPVPAFVSNNAQPIPLSGTPAGGSYSGSGVSGSQFNPATAGLGSRSVTYTYNSPNNCTGSATTTTVVYDTTGTVCTDYDTVTTTIYDTTYVSLTTTDTLLIDFATGIAPPNNTNTLKVYPNPAKDHLIINNGNLSAMTGYSIKVTNALGQIVFNQPVNQQQFYIDLSTWGGSGVYVLYVLDSQQNLKETKQIVLQ